MKLRVIVALVCAACVLAVTAALALHLHGQAGGAEHDAVAAIGTMVALVAGFLGWQLANWIVAPLRLMTEALRGGEAATLAQAAADTTHYREAADLAVTLSRLVTRLDEQNQLLASAFDTSLDAIVVIDQRGRIESVNRAAESLFGLPAASAIGRNIAAFMPEPYGAQHDGYLKRYLETGERRIIGIGRVVLAKRHDGSTFPCQLTVGESRAADGRRVFTGYLRDLSSIRAVEARLRTTQEELLQMGRLVTVGQIGSQLSHELNQPLGAIANYVGAVRQMLGTAPPEKLDEILGKVQAQLARATSVLQHLRSFVATSSGARQHININKVIEQSLALAMVGPRFERARVETDLAANLSSVPMDTTQIQQVIVNLFNNALEAHGENEHAHVAIRSYREGNHVVVDIADRGRGLDPAIRERLFAPFNTTKPRGLGLGLSICRSIIADHRGTMTALPNGERGTVFRFTLPIDDDTQS